MLPDQTFHPLLGCCCCYIHTLLHRLVRSYLQDQKAIDTCHSEMAYNHSNFKGSLDDAGQSRLCHLSMGLRNSSRVHIDICTVDLVYPDSHMLHNSYQLNLLPYRTWLVNFIFSDWQKLGDKCYACGWINIPPLAGKELQWLLAEPIPDYVRINPGCWILIFVLHQRKKLVHLNKKT